MGESCQIEIERESGRDFPPIWILVTLASVFFGSQDVTCKLPEMASKEEDLQNVSKQSNPEPDPDAMDKLTVKEDEGSGEYSDWVIPRTPEVLAVKCIPISKLNLLFQFSTAKSHACHA